MDLATIQKPFYYFGSEGMVCAKANILLMVKLYSSMKMESKQKEVSQKTVNITINIQVT